MNWKQLLFPKRVGDPNPDRGYSSERSPFQQDFDRIVFSDAILYAPVWTGIVKLFAQDL